MSSLAYFTPYQEVRPDIPNELAALREIAANTSAGGGGGGGGGSYPTGKQRALASSNATGNGSIAAGAVGIQMFLSSDFAGTINGNTYSGATLSLWSPPYLVTAGDTYPAIPYTISAGNANIDVLT